MEVRRWLSAEGRWTGLVAEAKEAEMNYSVARSGRSMVCGFAHQEGYVTSNQNETQGQRAALSTSDRRTLEALQRHPTAHNLAWTDVLALFDRLGSVERKPNAEFVFKLGAERHVMRRPHGKDLTAQEVVDLRKFLSHAELPSEPASETPTLTAPTLMVVMDHHGAKLYQVDATAADASHHTIKPYDPHHFQHHLTHKDQSREEGQRTAEDPGYYEQIAHALAGAGKIVVVGHGHGKSNASEHLVEHLRAHHSEIHRRIASELSADLSSVTTAQLLELARKNLQ